MSNVFSFFADAGCPGADPCSASALLQVSLSVQHFRAETHADRFKEQRHSVGRTAGATRHNSGKDHTISTESVAWVTDSVHQEQRERRLKENRLLSWTSTSSDWYNSSRIMLRLRLADICIFMSGVLVCFCFNDQCRQY